MLRRHGFLEDETPNLIIASVFGMLGAAVDADIRAKPEPLPPPPAPKASPPPTAPPPAPKAVPRRAKASPPAADVEALADEPDAPPAQLARRMNGNEHNPEAEAPARWLEHMARVQS